MVLILDSNDCTEPVWNWNESKCLEDVTISQTNITFSTKENEDNTDLIALS